MADKTFAERRAEIEADPVRYRRVLELEVLYAAWLDDEAVVMLMEEEDEDG